MALSYAGIEYLDPNGFGPRWLPQVALSSVTKLHHTASRTLLTQTFTNPTVSPITSAKYTFPLYESCAIVAFRCYVGMRIIDGMIKEKEDATATFQAALERNEPASLLEQHTVDVFSTSIGNVPPAETIKVEIEYIMELKHDAEVDGLRFTIPTSIAPRYGTFPAGLSKHGASRPVNARNMNISVEVSMPSSILSVQSPSHPISLYLGRHSTATPDDAFNPQHALATLGQTTTELGRDFILLIKSASLSSPAAMLEEHPTIPNSKALMITLVPKFNSPISTKPEVVFLIDRSGSMSPRVAPLKSSLSIFLKSLPLDVNFNICSFGSGYSFLWDQSRPYSNQSFAEAQMYCDHIQADFGGTEILPPIQATIQRRLIGLNLEIMVLTDGETWNLDVLFKYVEKETERGDVRLFTLGIGQDASHALVDGLARVGRGFSQVVLDEREGMESKVTRMLRGGLSSHVFNYRLEWEGKPTAEVVNLGSTGASSRISLFDWQANQDSPLAFSDSPDFTIPSVIQAPYKIQPLFPFSRCTAYVLLSSDAQPPSHVYLRGTTPEGNELEIKIEVQKVEVQGETIHQLAARKILQELKDGTSYVHGAIDKERQPALLAKWVEKEGVRVGLKYGVASQWTSFVAVEREEKEEDQEQQEQEQDPGVSPPSALDENKDWDMEAEHVNDDGDGMHRRSSGGPGTRVGLEATVMMMAAPSSPPIRSPDRSLRYLSSKPSDRLQKRNFAATESNYSESVASDDESFFSFQGRIQSRPASPWELSTSRSKPLPLAPPPLLSLKDPDSQQHSNSTQLGISFIPHDHIIKGYSDVLEEDSGVEPSYYPGQPLSSGTKTPSFPGSAGSASPLIGKAKRAMRVVASNSQVPFMRRPVRETKAELLEPHLDYSVDPGTSSPGPASAKRSNTVSSKRRRNRGEDLCTVEAYSDTYSGNYSGWPTSLSHKSHSSSTQTTFNSPDIGMSYSSSSTSLVRHSADPEKPLSSKTKSLIDLQTFEGYFIFDSALATLLGVSLSDLRVPLLSVRSPNLSWRHYRWSVWATVLAIKFFETQLAEERSVWELVVDKARLWIRSQAGVGDEVNAQLEKRAEKILGV